MKFDLAHQIMKGEEGRKGMRLIIMIPVLAGIWSVPPGVCKFCRRSQYHTIASVAC